MQVATLTRERHVTKRVKKVKTKSKGLSVCMMSQELSTLVDLALTETVATTTGWMDAEFWARHTERETRIFFKTKVNFSMCRPRRHMSRVKTVRQLCAPVALPLGKDAIVKDKGSHCALHKGV
jgi:hypothetical protein